MSGIDGLIGMRPRGFDELAPRVGGVGISPAGDGAGGAAGVDFQSVLGQAVRGVVDLQEGANEQAMALVRGEPVHVHDVLVAMGKSEVAFDLMLEVRNKLLQAWETLSRSVV